MLALKILANFIKALNAKDGSRAIAGGLALGSVMGLTPVGSLHNGVVLLLIFILPVNKSASIVGTVLFSLVGFWGDPVFNRVGYFLLTHPSLQNLWTTLYNTPVVPWTRFNNTLTLGSLVCAVLFSPFLFWIIHKGVLKYRQHVVAVAAQWKLVRWVQATRLYLLYQDLP